MWLGMGIILAVMLPLSRVFPPLYGFRVRSQIFRWYAQLREIENCIDGTDARTLVAELSDLEHRAEKISVLLSYTSALYALRGDIQLVRRKLREVTATPLK